MSINYNFVAVPQDMLSILYRKHLTGNQLLVLLAVSEEVLKFPEGRASLTRELACRYIANKINISFQAVSRALKKLVELGLITILEVGKKYVGSIIKLNIPCETNIVTLDMTHNENIVASGRTNKRTLIKNVKEQTTGYDVAVSLKNINSDPSPQGNTTSNFTGHVHNGNSSSIAPSLMGENEEVSLTPQNSINTVNNSIALTQEKYKVFGREVNNYAGSSEVTLSKVIPETDNDSIRSKDSHSVTLPLKKEEFKELSTVAAGIGIKPSLLSSGIKELAGRKCHNIKSTLQDILSQIKSRAAAIKKIPAYFVSLCQNVEIEDPSPAPREEKPNGGFRPLPDWLQGEPSSGCSSTEIPEPPPVDTLEQKRHDFAEKISNYFKIGRVKYVLSPAGVAQKIIACNNETLSYVKDGASLRHIDWKNLPEKLLNEVWFIGEE